MPMKEVYKMTWAEFQLRSFGYWEERKFKMQMIREISYEVHGLNYLMSKKKRPNKKQFWNIEGSILKEGGEERKNVYLEAMKLYEKEKNG